MSDQFTETIPNSNLNSPGEKVACRDYIEIIGWLLSVIAPVLLYSYTPPISISGFGDEPKTFLCILMSAGIMWGFALLPEFIPGLFVLLASLLLALVEPSVILSGFASSTFIIVLSIVIMTLAISQSGIMQRVAYALLKNTHTLQGANWRLFGFGVLMTPILPSIISRTQIFGPLVNQLSSEIKVDNQECPKDRLFANGFYGVFLLSSSFLSASLLNFVIISLLPLQEQQQFQTQGWFQASIVLTGILLLAYVIVLPMFYRGKENKQKISHTFSANLKKMGKISTKEIVSLSVLFIFFIGILTTRYHHISSSWLGFSILFLLLVFNFINLDDFQKKIDWSYLFFLSSIVGISSMFRALNLDSWLYQQLLTLFPSILDNKLLLLASLSGLTIFLRFALPVGAVVALLAPVVMAIANKLGISGWALSLALLLVGDIWFFPYQCTFYQYYKDSFDTSKIQERNFLMFNAAINVVKLFALFASFYYWQYLSLI